MTSVGKDISLAVTGDSFITTKISCYQDPDFLGIFDIIRNQTLGFTNLEVLLNDYIGIPAADSGGTYAGAPTHLTEDLKWAGFQCVSRANNHSLDYSYEGMRITTEVLDAAGICHAGVGEYLGEARSPAYMETKDGRVALLSASSTFAPWGRAGDQRPDFQGRPGLSPLRYSLKYKVTKEHMANLRRLIDDFGFSKSKDGQRWARYDEGQVHFGGLTFVESDTFDVWSEPLQSDVQDIAKWISDAKRQADWVLYSLHAHEAKVQREIPADFIVTFARQCIDAGADIFIGHGPHVLRGIEIYKGKPIFYSLGNFIFQNDLVKKHPQDIYDRANLGLLATPADMYQTRSKNDTTGFPADRDYWESVLGVLEFKNKRLVRLEVFPLFLGFGNPRPQRGRPVLARGEDAERILERLKKLSAPYGTDLRIEGEKGFIQL